MNRPVLPSYFSVFDDPSQQRFGNQDLIGFYQVDDQGVPAKRVSLIEDGLLTDLLMEGVRTRIDPSRTGTAGRVSPDVKRRKSAISSSTQKTAKAMPI
jgi:predicted Zn-dependent protease